MANRPRRPVVTPKQPATKPPVDLKTVADQKEPRKGVFISDMTLAVLKSTKRRRSGEEQRSIQERNPFQFPVHPRGVLPEGEVDKVSLAQDEALTDLFAWGGAFTNAFSDGLIFMGYAELAILNQRPEYRVISETIAEEMTREWIEFESVSGDDKKKDKINQLEDAVKEFGLKDCFYEAASQDGKFGRAHIYIDCAKDTDDREELKSAIGNGQDFNSRAKFSKAAENSDKGAKLQAFRNVEAIWTYPTDYNSVDPLKSNWYKPDSWFVMGKQVHSTRLLTFVGKPVPDILKPAYSFGGVSLTQMAKPYVDNWLRTRQSVADLVRSFVVQGLKTNLAVLNQTGGHELINRIEAFNALRDNHDSFLLDKETEEWFNVTTSLAGLDALQAQSQEQMASVSRIPLVKLLGISPHGLNATAEPEIRVFYDTIKSYQEKQFRKPLTTCIHFIMLHLWGEIDDEITFHFKDLWQLDEVAKTGVEKTKSDIDDQNIANGTISPEEARERLAKDKDSQYNDIDLSGPPPEPPMPPGGGLPGEEGEGEPPEGPGGLASPPGGPGGFPGDNGAPDFAKSDVAFEHPAVGKDSCLECEHFQDGSDSCELVRGLVRPEDWCELFEPEVGLGHWLWFAPIDPDSDDFDADFGSDEADWEEDKHKRDKSGKFTSGSGGGGPNFPASKHKTKVKNSLVKSLSSHGYKKTKGLTKEGHHVFEHPSGHKVYVGPSKEDQEFVAGYRLGGTHKFGSGAGSLAKHLTQHHGAPGMATPKPAAGPVPFSSKVVGHHAAALHNKITIAGGVPTENDAETVNYKFPDGSELLVGKEKVPNTGVYPWVLTPVNASALTGEGGVAFEKKWNELHHSGNPAKSKLTAPLGAKVQATSQASYADILHLETGEVIFTYPDGKWKITNKGVNVEEGKGQEALNFAFEALHPRGEHGEFIKKPGSDIKFEADAMKELEKQGFKKSAISSNIFIKGDIAVGFHGGGNWQMKDKDGKVINSDFYNYNKIFETKIPDDQSQVKVAPSQEVIPPSSPKQAVGQTLHFPGMTKTGEQLGSNPGGRYKDENGNEYYVKQPKSNDHAKNEILAASLFAAAGGNTLNYHQIVDGGKMYVGTDWKPLEKNNMSQLLPSQLAEARKDFAVHAWLANWDATGLTGDNIGVVDGKVMPLDFGGSLLYRAQGGEKGHLFNSDATEWNTLRDPSKNPKAASLYGSMTPEQLKESAKRLENISYDTIKSLVQQYGPGDQDAKTSMIVKLVQRKEAILQKANQKAPPPAPPPPPVKHEAGTGTLMPGTQGTFNPGANQLVVDPSNPSKGYSAVYSDLNKIGSSTRPTPTGAEEQYVGSYTGAGYHEVNDCLRYLTDCEHINGIKEIRGYIARAKTDKPLTLFRGINGPYMQKMNEMFKKAHAHGKPAVFEDGGFLSMSTSESVSRNFAHSNSDNMFIIEVPAGSHVASANNLSEYEMMGQQGSRLIVTGKDPLTGYWKAKLDQSHMIEKAE